MMTFADAIKVFFAYSISKCHKTYNILGLHSLPVTHFIVTLWNSFHQQDPKTTTNKLYKQYMYVLVYVMYV